MENFPFGGFTLLVTKIGLRNLANSTIIRSYYYDGIVESIEEKKYETQKKIFDGINLYPNYEVRLGRLVKEDNGKFRQKGVPYLDVFYGNFA